jgi:hypothetical protein
MKFLLIEVNYMIKGKLKMFKLPVNLSVAGRRARKEASKSVF